MAGWGIGMQGLMEARGMFLAIGGALEDTEAVGPVIFEALNRQYERKFNDWNGYMVETGATKAAWTQNEAPGAIRNIFPESIEFGSDIAYNRYHYKELLSARDSEVAATEITELVAEHYVPRSGIFQSFSFGSAASTAMSYLRRLIGSEGN